MKAAEPNSVTVLNVGGSVSVCVLLRAAAAAQQNRQKLWREAATAG